MAVITINTPNIYGVGNPRPGIGTFVVCSFEGNVDTIKPVWHGVESQSFPEEFASDGRNWHYGIVATGSTSNSKLGEPWCEFTVELHGPVVTGLGWDVSVLALPLQPREFTSCELVRLRANPEFNVNRTVIDAVDQWEAVKASEVRHGDTIAMNNVFGIPTVMALSAIQTVWSVSDGERVLMSTEDCVNHFTEYVDRHVQRPGEVARYWSKFIPRATLAVHELIVDRVFSRKERNFCDVPNPAAIDPVRLANVLRHPVFNTYWKQTLGRLKMDTTDAKAQQFVRVEKDMEFDFTPSSADASLDKSISAVSTAMKVMCGFKDDDDFVKVVANSVSDFWDDVKTKAHAQAKSGYRMVNDFKEAAVQIREAAEETDARAQHTDHVITKPVHTYSEWVSTDDIRITAFGVKDINKMDDTLVTADPTSDDEPSKEQIV